MFDLKFFKKLKLAIKFYAEPPTTHYMNAHQQKSASGEAMDPVSETRNEEFNDLNDEFAMYVRDEVMAHFDIKFSKARKLNGFHHRMQTSTFCT